MQTSHILPIKEVTRMRLTHVWLLTLALITNVSCATREAEQGQASHAVLPAGLSYAITDSIGGGRVRLVLHVLLSEKQSESVLRDLATSMRSAGRMHYQYFTVTYTLPGLTNSYWATADLAPTSETKILGLTAADEATLIAEPIPRSREILGRWVNDGVAGGLLSIFREEGRLYREHRFSPTSAVRSEVRESKSSLGQKFEIVGSTTGDNWVVEPTGLLQIRDSDGLIATARRIR
jgi:hypothetical protein